MKKRTLFAGVLLAFCMILFIGCDPIWPENIKADYEPKTLTQGSTAEIEIIYPSSDTYTSTFDWSEPVITIISGDDVVEVSDFTITGLTPGTAILKIETTLGGSFAVFWHEKKTFSTELTVEVK